MNYDNLIDFSESFILGWKRKSSCLKIFVELYLLPSHPLFLDFDKEEYGCYKVGTIVIDSAKIEHGIFYDDCEPKWNGLTNEYKDVFEIDLLEIYDNQKLRIVCEHLEWLITGKRIYIDMSEGALLG